MRAAAVGSGASLYASARPLYILPTRYGLLYAVVLLTMFLAAINYANGLSYALTFLLTALALVAMVHTHRNLHRLHVAPGGAVPVFVGDTAVFRVVLHNPTPLARFGVEVNHLGYTAIAVDIAPGGSATVALPVTARRRGRLAAAPISIVTRFPLGLWRAWSRRTALAQSCLVYPQPAPPGSFVAPSRAGGAGGQGNRDAGDDFRGLREFRAGDAPQHVAWKAVARGQGWLVKQFTDGESAVVWLDWATLAAHEPEARLSLLCRGVLDAERAGYRYGLRLPGNTIAPGLGDTHSQRCLEALALFPLA